MRFRSILGSATAGAVLTATAIVAAGAAPAQAAPARGLGTTSLASVLGADGVKFDSNWKDFDIVEAAVYAVAAAKPDSPVLVLADGTKRLTAFVPTDKAFRNLVKDLTGKSYSSEKKVFTKLAGLVDIDTIETVLLYHVVPGKTLTSNKVLKADGAKLTTAQGGKVKVDVKMKPSLSITLKDRDKNDRDPKVVLKALDLNKGNKQVAHGIDRVLRPIDL